MEKCSKCYKYICKYFYNLYIHRKLTTLDYSKTPWLSLNKEIILARVVDVYDGDTITIIFNLSGTFYKEKCRLANIDTAEIRTKNIEEKKVALETKKFLSNIILDRIIYIKCGKWDKFGRLLGYLYLQEKDIKKDDSINNLLLNNGMAYQYSGKTKEKFDNWKEIHI